jgi:diguanylate cyclase (GGDEF)-like protein
LQASLRHLAWKVQRLEAGDYDQRINFLGEISESFNNMAISLKTAREELLQKEETLVALATSLQKEVRKRNELLHELKVSEEKFKYLAQRDPLTDLLNRRSFFSLAEMNLKSALSSKESSVVCLLDLDDFKKLNDTFGHLEGDRALQHVVKHSLGALRQSDIMGRYGGEEFIFMLTGMGEAQGYVAADRIRQSIKKHAFPLENGDTVPITASIGIAIIQPDENASDIPKILRKAIAQADIALYEAKVQGKDQVRIAQDRPENL